MVPSIIWRAKNLLRWVYALRWVPVQTLDKWCVLLENLTPKLALYVLLEVSTVWTTNRCFVLKNIFIGTLEVESDVGSLYGASVWLYVGVGASGGSLGRELQFYFQFGVLKMCRTIGRLGLQIYFQSVVLEMKPRVVGASVGSQYRSICRTVSLCRGVQFYFRSGYPVWSPCNEEPSCWEPD